MMPLVLRSRPGARTARRSSAALLLAPLVAAGLLVAGPAGAQTQTKDLNAEIAAPGKPKPPAVPAAPADVAVSMLPLGSSILKLGEPIRFRVTSNVNGFGHLYVTNTSGTVLMVAENVPLKAGRSIDLPKTGVILRAAPPAGDNRVLFLATREKFKGFGGGEMVERPSDVQLTGFGLVSSLRLRLATTPRADWAFTELTIRVTE